MKRVLTGIQPSGILHIGNYFGAISSAIRLQETADESFLFIADFHSLTVNPDPDDLRSRVQRVALDFLACGLDPEKTLFFYTNAIRSAATNDGVTRRFAFSGFTSKRRSSSFLPSLSAMKIRRHTANTVVTAAITL